jgi:hypothetical protein
MFAGTSMCGSARSRRTEARNVVRPDRSLDFGTTRFEIAVEQTAQLPEVVRLAGDLNAGPTALSPQLKRNRHADAAPAGQCAPSRSQPYIQSDMSADQASTNPEHNLSTSVCRHGLSIVRGERRQTA